MVTSGRQQPVSGILDSFMRRPVQRERERERERLFTCLLAGWLNSCSPSVPAVFGWHFFNHTMQKPRRAGYLRSASKFALS